jgi:hypothetical protein
VDCSIIGFHDIPGPILWSLASGAIRIDTPHIFEPSAIAADPLEN